MQTTNLCHLLQNNYREINTPFDHFPSDLIWSRLWKCMGEMIKSLLNGTDHYCVQRSAGRRITDTFYRLSLHLAWPLCLFSLCLFTTDIRVKITFSVNSDFDAANHFSLDLPCRSDLGKRTAGLLLWGQNGDGLGVYWLQPDCSARFHLLLARRQTASEIWLASIIKSDIFIPPILGTASRHLVTLMPGKACSFDR